MYTGLHELCKLSKGSYNSIIIEYRNDIISKEADGQGVGVCGLGTRNE